MTITFDSEGLGGQACAARCDPEAATSCRVSCCRSSEVVRVSVLGIALVPWMPIGQSVIGHWRGGAGTLPDLQRSRASAFATVLR